MKCNIILALVLLFSFLKAQGQSSQIKGQVIEQESKEPIPFATVAAYNELELVDGVMADENGKFQIKYSKTISHLEVSFIGYQPVCIRLPAIENKKETIIALPIEVSDLHEVTIRGRKSTTQVGIDRKIINIGSDIQQSGVNALEAFDQIAETQVDYTTGTLSLRGNDNVRVLVNGKPSALSTQELLQQLLASSIDRIEIITSPAAKHKADGLSGIINIILIAETNPGLNLALNSSIGTKRYGFGIAGNYNFTGLNLRLNASRSTLKTTNNQTIQREFEAGMNESIFTPYQFDGSVYKIAIGSDIFINEKHEFTFDIDYTEDIHNYFNKSSYNIGAPDSYDYLRENDHFHYIAIYNTNYRLKLNGDNHFLEVDYNLNDSNNSYPIADYKDNYLIFNQYLTENFRLQALALDYILPIKDKMVIETGIAGNTQALKSQRSINEVGQSTVDNQFNYDETLFGAYGLAKFSIGQLKLQTGLRLEHFASKSKSPTNYFATMNKFINLFPSAHFSYAIKDNSTVNLGYSKRVSRPNFHHVNAYQIVSPLFIWEYNPTITPEISDNIELSIQQSFKKLTWGLTTFYRYRKNVILWVASSTADRQVFRYENSGIFNSFGIESLAKYNIAIFWSSSLTANYYFTAIDQSSTVTYDKVRSASIQLKNTFYLNKNITTDISYLYTPKQNNAFSTNEPRNRLDCSINAKFLKNELSVSLRVADLFNSNIYKRYTKTANLSQTTIWEMQASMAFNFLLSVNYKLFEKEIRNRKRKERAYNKTPLD